LRWSSRVRSLTVAALCCGLAQAADVARGQRLYLGNCAPCHGPSGDGGKGADLTVPKYRRAPDDPTLFRVIRYGIPGTEMPLTRHLQDRDIQDVVAFLHGLRRRAPQSLRGDAARGEQLYRTKGNCAQCHTLRGRGGAMGPDLTGIGARRSPAHLRGSLVSPEAAVPENFMVYRLFSVIPDNFLLVRVATRDGRRITGVRVNEDPFSIQIRDLSDRLHSFWKEELVEVQRDRGKSPMPGYRSVLSEGEIDDLVAYLVSLREEM
jgi:putative heme-binding domain-containing protein